MLKNTLKIIKSRAALYLILVAIIMAGVAALNVFLLPNSTRSPNQKNSLNKTKIFASQIKSMYDKIRPAGSDISLIIQVTDQDGSSPAQTLKINQSDTFELAFEYRYFVENDKLNTEFIKKVLIHEYMHVLSLQNSQFKIFNQNDFDPANIQAFDLAEKNCEPNYFNTDGCLASSSYLSLFYNKFWTNSLKAEYDRIQSIENKEQFNQELESWSQKYKDNFVSQIAFVSPEEDLAESFSLWVLDYQIENKTQIQKEKIDFFKQFPELQIIKANYIAEFDRIFEI